MHTNAPVTLVERVGHQSRPEIGTADTDVQQVGQTLAAIMQSPSQGEHVITLRGPYDIAVNKQPDGTFGLTTDWWAGHVEQEVGKSYGKLLQLYGVHKTRLEARRKGYTLRRQTLADGAIKLTIGGVR